ncbi:MAG: flagellin, partial [Candidatus Azotimanducaceae bacterium]
TVLDGSFYGKQIQVGTDAGQNIAFSVAALDSWALGEAPVVTGQATSEGVHNATDNILTVATSNASSFSVGDLVGFGGSDVHWSSASVTAVSTDSISISVDSEHAGYINANIASGDDNMFLMGQKIGGVDLSTDAGAQQALTTITAAIEQVSGQRAEYGALQNRLEYTVSNLMNVSEFTTAARSRIEDADFAAESARLAKAQVLQQTGTAMLAQANSSSQLVLSLVR